MGRQPQALLAQQHAEENHQRHHRPRSHIARGERNRREHGKQDDQRIARGGEQSPWPALMLARGHDTRPDFRPANGRLVFTQTFRIFPLRGDPLGAKNPSPSRTPRIASLPPGRTERPGLPLFRPRLLSRVSPLLTGYPQRTERPDTGIDETDLFHRLRFGRRLSALAGRNGDAHPSGTEFPQWDRPGAPSGADIGDSARAQFVRASS